MVTKKAVVKNSVQKPANPNKILVENFVALQEVMTNLSLEFDNLTDQISKLLNLFEISAKAIAEKEFTLDKGDKSSKKIIEKLDNLLEQNKIIARGLTLIHEKNEPQEMQMQPMQRFPTQNMKQKPLNQMPRQEMNGFEKSISSKDKNDSQNF